MLDFGEIPLISRPPLSFEIRRHFSLRQFELLNASKSRKNLQFSDVHQLRDRAQIENASHLTETLRKRTR